MVYGKRAQQCGSCVEPMSYAFKKESSRDLFIFASMTTRLGRNRKRSRRGRRKRNRRRRRRFSFIFASTRHPLRVRSITG